MQIQALRADLDGVRRQFDYQNETRRKAEQNEAENNAALHAELEVQLYAQPGHSFAFYDG